MKKNFISVIVPMYNAEKFIENCIDSILDQDYQYKEIIVVDDGSSDNSFSICKEKYQNRINLIKQKNFGAPSARNKGLEIANGEYVMFLDSDDYLNDKKVLSEMIKKIEDDNSDVCVGNMNVVDENNIFVKKKKIYFEDITEDNLYNLIIDPLPSGKIFRKKIIEDNNIYFSNVRIGQDLNFYLKVVSCTDRVSKINKTVSNYRIVNNSISRTYSIKILDIMTSLKDVEKFYIQNKIQDLKYLKVVELQHIYSQFGKYVYFKKIYERKFIKKYFLQEIKNLKINMNDYNNETQKFIKKMYKKIFIKNTYCYYFYKLVNKNG